MLSGGEGNGSASAFVDGFSVNKNIRLWWRDLNFQLPSCAKLALAESTTAATRVNRLINRRISAFLLKFSVGELFDHPPRPLGEVKARTQ